MSHRSTVTQHLVQESQTSGHFVAHFFYTHSRPSQLRATHLFESYAKQILGYLSITHKPCPSDIVLNIKRSYGSTQSSFLSYEEMISEIFLPLCRLVPNATYVVDGLDECHIKEISNVLQVFHKMLDLGAKIFISGREEINVSNAILDCVQICVAEDKSKEDISSFIDWKIGLKMRERTLTENQIVIKTMKDTLNESADRM